MRNGYAVHCLTLVLISSLFAKADAAELAPLSAAELHERCLGYALSAESKDGLICGTYVRGFIEGSEIVELEVVSPDRGETFTQRAFRTRVGGTRTVTPRYCVNSSVTLSQFIIQMLAQAESSPPSRDEGASVLLLGTLARYHLCSARPEP
jgi:hypothetical protein